uniref:Putative fructose-1,6-biphosphate aldolase n=2 Tax=environmental samples TaxID=48479 RepID=A0A0H3UAH6_9BACT|nr:putative fructose-1,6-biphosphate aldolase [uncultured bacterium fosmid pJB45G2]
MGIDYVVANARTAAARTNVPIALHLDHGSSFDIVMKCIRAGFSSVMFDGSRYPYDENVRLTRKVVEAAHAVGVSVEGELGTIGGIEEDLDVHDGDIRLPGADEAIRFWKDTGVDALAVSVGTAHGMYKKEPHIRCDTIREIVSGSGAPFVLHGGSGVPDAMIREAIEAGVSKINVNTESQIAFTREVRRLLDENAELFDAKAYLGAAKNAVKEVVRSKIRLFGSNGKAGI